jgi:hypothetical protein
MKLQEDRKTIRQPRSRKLPCIPHFGPCKCCGASSSASPVEDRAQPGCVVWSILGVLNQFRGVQLFYTKRSSLDLYIQTDQACEPRILLALSSESKPAKFGSIIHSGGRREGRFSRRGAGSRQAASPVARMTATTASARDFWKRRRMRRLIEPPPRHAR